MCGEILWDYPNLQFHITLSPVTAFTIHWWFCNSIRLLYLVVDILNSSCAFPSPTHLFIDSIPVSVWTYGFSFYSVSYNPLPCLFWCSASPNLASGSPSSRSFDSWLSDHWSLLSGSRTFFVFFTARNIRTGFASGYTQLGYESHGAAVGQRGEKWQHRSEFQSNSEGRWRQGMACQPLCPAAAAAAKSLQSCPTLCDPIDGSPPGSPVPGILQARTLEWVAIAFSNAWKWKWKGSRSVVPDS